MIEWPLFFASGFLGSAHCLGMCGPFVLTLGAATPGHWGNLARQLAYAAGRIFTYAVLGGGAAFLGLKAAGAVRHWANLPAVLAIVAGGILAVEGLFATGLIRRPGVAGAAVCPGAAGFRRLLATPRLPEAFLAGLFTGFLPCGLLYGMLVLAASTHQVGLGVATMAVFGFGTVPALLALGLGGGLLGRASQQRLRTVAAWCLLLTGLVSIARGAGGLSLGSSDPASCIFCDDEICGSLPPVTNP